MGRAKKDTTSEATKRNTSKRDSAPSSSQATAAKTICWPKLKPKKGLAVSELVTGHIFLIRDLLDRAECDGFIKIADEQCVPTPGIPKRGEAFRNNARWSTIDHGLAQRLWLETGIAKLLSSWRHPDGKTPAGLFENIRLYRYGPGEKFGRHYDDYFFDSHGRRSEYTLLVYLNSVDDPRFRTSERACGGQTVFYARRMEPVSVNPELGLALLHKHGADCLQHEALELRNSFKYVLRSDLIFE
ncbi:hypothetical protein H4R99_008465 [Coemansia sp. RSA 1722]|nr:hypothetical protein IWW45_004061 [Coemansia sp. RSA 485]KAJ2586411.1 hypothetical protein H4R99_008465 [Coemansia sp. RSA 1722]KAJ2602941.1 hypothetical protein GGF39_000444 [Coemansia sp. RSA 1721]KAJ2640025.1 hypothetical protein GGF40_000387 [Coemansia sp. RSA 1286]